MGEAWSTVVTRESEWDDRTRSQVEGLRRYDDECCPGCGMHKSILDDFGNHHFVYDEQWCPACASQSRYGRVVADRDDKATPKDQNGQPAWETPRTPRPDDGRHTYLRRMSPEEVERRRGSGESPRKRPS